MTKRKRSKRSIIKNLRLWHKALEIPYVSITGPKLKTDLIDAIRLIERLREPAP